MHTVNETERAQLDQWKEEAEQRRIRERQARAERLVAGMARNQAQAQAIQQQDVIRRHGIRSTLAKTEFEQDKKFYTTGVDWTLAVDPARRPLAQAILKRGL